MSKTLPSFSDELAGLVRDSDEHIVRIEARRRLPASGVIWSKDGIIVTANHVLRKDEDINISQAALARPCPTNNKLADRFEVFLGRHELANGYVELTDPAEQLRRFASDQLVRESRGQEQRPVDNAFVAAMQAGLPACAGVAAGFDRLLMIHAGTDDIRKVQTFAFAESEK